MINSRRADSPAFEIVQPDNAGLWNAYVLNHPKGTVFHTAEMVEAYRATHNHEPLALAASLRGRIMALLVAVRVQVLSGLAGHMSSRSIFYAEPICEASEQGQLALAELVRLHDRHVRSNTILAEVRPIRSSGRERRALETCGYAYKSYLNYLVDLRQSRDQLWAHLTKSCRQTVRRNFRRGMEVRDETTSAGVERMYRLIQVSYGRSKVPLADVGLFHAALDKLPAEIVKVRTCYWQNEPLASGISLTYKGVVFAWYGGSIRRTGLAPFDCLTWSEIEHGQEHGQQVYDFGGAGWPDEVYGPRDFKAKFGGRQVDYGRYQKVYSPWKLTLASKAYAAARYFAFSSPGAGGNK